MSESGNVGEVVGAVQAYGGHMKEAGAAMGAAYQLHGGTAGRLTSILAGMKEVYGMMTDFSDSLQAIANYAGSASMKAAAAGRDIAPFGLHDSNNEHANNMTGRQRVATDDAENLALSLQSVRAHFLTMAGLVNATIEEGIRPLIAKTPDRAREIDAIRGCVAVATEESAAYARDLSGGRPSA